MSTHINIKISRDTYARLNILKGWLGARKRQRVGLDEAIAQGIAEVCRLDESLAQAIEAALEDKPGEEEKGEAEYA